MDKWKDLELEKMKAGGNRNARIFFEAQDDYHDGMSLTDKYNTKAAALYRDKVSDAFIRNFELDGQHDQAHY